MWCMVFLSSGTEPKTYPRDMGIDVAGFGHTRFQPVCFFIVAEIVQNLPQTSFGCAVHDVVID